MNKKVMIFVLAVILVTVAYYFVLEMAPTSDETFEVDEIIDGDTIRLQSGEKVRLIGINTPESDQHYYSQATDKLMDLIGDGPVILKSDVDDKDQYGRLLRYVYINDTMVNMEMVRLGYAQAYPFEPNVKYSQEFADAEAEARTAQRGIWEPSTFSLTVTELHFDAEGDDSQNLNGEYVVFTNPGTSIVPMVDWVLCDRANNCYTFGEFGLGNESSFTLFTGSGSDSPAELYWGSTNPIWNNGGDGLFLRDDEGLLVCYYAY